MKEFKKRFMNEREMAEHLSCSVAWLRKRRVVGGGPVFVKLGRLVRYPVDNADEYLDSLPRLTSTAMYERC